MNVRYRVDLSQIERTELRGLLSGGKHASRRLKRAQILLAADAGASDEEIARSVGVGGSTVYRTKRRFVEGNLERALSDEPRPGAERKLSGKEEALLVATAEGAWLDRHRSPPAIHASAAQSRVTPHRLRPGRRAKSNFPIAKRAATIPDQPNCVHGAIVKYGRGCTFVRSAFSGYTVRPALRFSCRPIYLVLVARSRGENVEL